MWRREIDAIGTVFGLLFAVIGVSALMRVAEELIELEWLWPTLLLVLGVGMILQASNWLRCGERRAGQGTDPALGTAPKAEGGMAPEAPTVPLKERDHTPGQP